MTNRRVVRAALVSVLFGFCFLEALAWARLGAIDVVTGSFPHPAVTRSGDPIFWTWHAADGVPSGVAIEVWNADGSPIGSGDFADPLDFVTRRYNRLKVSAQFWTSRVHGVDKTSEHAAFFPPYGSRWPAYGSELNDAERVARELDDEFRGSFALYGPGASGQSFPRFLTEGLGWRFESGRFVARNGSGVVRLVIGPKGTSTVLPESGENRFGRLVDVKRSFGHHPSTELMTSSDTHLMFDADASTLVEFSLRDGKGALGFDVTVREVPLRPAAPGEVPGNENLLLITPPGRILVVDPQGVIWSDVAVGEGEGRVISQLGSAPRDSLLEPERTPWEFTAVSDFDTGDPFVIATRLRHQTLGQPMTTQDLTWRPTGRTQRALAALACVPAVLRPLPLTAASFLSGAPTDGESGSTWWWRDPILSAQRRPVALAANVLLSVLCAFLAWRIARVHCRTTAAANAWTLAGLLLGPLGVFLLRILVVRAPAEKVGRGKRSLLLDTCPATDTPWPEPARTGREILAEG